MQQERSFLRRL